MNLLSGQKLLSDAAFLLIWYVFLWLVVRYRTYCQVRRWLRGRGVVASVLVQSGTLTPGDAFIAGQQYGRARAMFDERGRTVQSAGPSTPVEVLGWAGTPAADRYSTGSGGVA